MSNPEKKEKKNKYYYAVKCGFKPGIYTKWDECKEQVNGFPKPVYKKFDTEEDAKIFINPECSYLVSETTKSELIENCFFINGDLGKIDKDGYIHIVGRDKDLIISGGYNIYPKELEVFLDKKLGVLESAVIGVPHPDFGETPIALIVSSKDSVPDLKEIKNHIKKSIARYKHPRKIIIIDELPRNSMCKVQKNILRNIYKSLFKN